jgi:hypothetical protein
MRRAPWRTASVAKSDVAMLFTVHSQQTYRYSAEAIRDTVPVPNREHDPTLVEFVYCVQHAIDLWRRSYDAHAEGSVSIHKPVVLGGEVFRPVHLLERSEAFRGRPDM